MVHAVMAVRNARDEEGQEPEKDEDRQKTRIKVFRGDGGQFLFGELFERGEQVE